MTFVSLHNHTGIGSPYDGMDTPVELVNEAIRKGMNAIAITEHGNMNSLGVFVNHVKAINKKREDEGNILPPFKAIYGVEGYYCSSVEQWKIKHARFDELKTLKIVKKAPKKDKVKVEVTDDLTDIEAEEFSGWVVGEAEFIKLNKLKKKSIEAEAGIDALKLELQDLLYSIKEKRHILILAKNETGLKNLYHLVSTSYSDGYFYKFPRMDWELLVKHKEGLIISVACMGGILGDIYKAATKGLKEPPDDELMANILDAMDEENIRFQNEFGDNFFNEIQFNSIEGQKEINALILNSAYGLGIPLIVTTDTHFPLKSQWETRQMYNKMRWMRAFDEPVMDWPDTVEEMNQWLWLKNEEEMWESYQKFSPELDELDIKIALHNTGAIADMVDLYYPNNDVQLPSFSCETDNPDLELAELAVLGLKKMGLGDNEEYIDRLVMELDVIEYRKISKYFLAMKLITDRARKSRLCGGGRGSAAGSLVSYVLEITEVDPILFNLSFERFLTRGGHGYPDIDFDVERPAEFKQDLIAEWGKEKVVFVSNWTRFHAKSLIKDVSKFFGISYYEVNQVTAIMMDEIIEVMKLKRMETPDEEDDRPLSANTFSPTLEELLYSETYKKFADQYPDIKPHIATLMGQVKGVGTHAGGIIVGDDLFSAMPLIRQGDKMQTPWPESGSDKTLESMGQVKFDVLGLNTLEMIHDCINVILLDEYHQELAQEGLLVEDEPLPDEVPFSWVKAFYEKNLSPKVNFLDDKDVWEHIFEVGNWLGIFQFTSGGMQDFCKQVCPTNIIELAAITAIYRPGPMGANVHEKFAEAKKNHNVFYYNEIHKEITESTYGFLVFQEQLAELVSRLGEGISTDEGHLVRKLLTSKGAKQKAQALEYKEKFTAGCLNKGMDYSDIDQLWSEVVLFSGYGFNFSHAVSYSIISYQCAWLAVHYPLQWACAFLDKEVGSSGEDLAKAVTKVKGMAILNERDKIIAIEPLDINVSGRVWSINGNGCLVPPITMIKGVGDKAVEAILKYRPFEKFETLVDGSMPRTHVNKKIVTILVQSGAVDKLLPLIPNFIHKKQLEMAIEGIEVFPKLKSVPGEISEDPNIELVDGELIDPKKRKFRPFKSAEEFHTRLIELHDEQPLTNEEECQIQYELTGISQVGTLIDEDMLEAICMKLESGDLVDVMAVNTEKDYKTWFVIKDFAPTHAKTSGKPYYRIDATNAEGSSRMVYAFGDPGKQMKPLKRWGIYIALNAKQVGEHIFMSLKNLKPWR